MNTRTERIDHLFTSRSFVVEAALVRIAAVIEQVKNLDDTTVFFELAAARMSAEIGALTDGATLAKFVSRKLVTLRKLARHTWEEWNVSSRPKYRSFGGGLVGSASTQMRGVVDAMRDALAAYSDEEFDRIEKVDSQFDEIVNAAKAKDSTLVSVVRHKVAYLSLLIEKLLGYDPVSALVSEAGDGDWTDVLIERLRNEPDYIKLHVINDDGHVEDGVAQWKDVINCPQDFIYGKFRIRYFEKNSYKYFELVNQTGESYLYLINFFLLHTGITLVFDDLSVQRVNSECRDIVFAVRKSSIKKNFNSYLEEAYKETFFAKHIRSNGTPDGVKLASVAMQMDSDIYDFDDEVTAMKGSKEICYALEWLCASDTTNPGAYLHLATAYINAGWPPVAKMLICRAYNNSFVDGGADKCSAYERHFPNFFKGVSRPRYLSQQDLIGQFVSYLQDTRKGTRRMMRIPDSVWTPAPAPVSVVQTGDPDDWPF